MISLIAPNQDMSKIIEIIPKTFGCIYYSFHGSQEVCKPRLPVESIFNRLAQIDILPNFVCYEILEIPGETLWAAVWHSEFGLCVKYVTVAFGSNSVTIRTPDDFGEEFTNNKFLIKINQLTRELYDTNC